ncbi:MAG TPA: PKD domain-containing protein [Candidatus Eisenbacteria bacterium]
MNATEGDTISITATAGSGDPHSILQIQLQGQPHGLTLTYGGTFSSYATLSGILPFDTAGTWILSWTVRDQFGAYDSTATSLVIADNPHPVNLPPLADIGGPYHGVLGVPVEMDATGSYDPEGAPLTYAWDFDDGFEGAGGTVSHPYMNTGTYRVSVVVSDGSLSDQDETNVTITNDLLGYAFVTRGDSELRLDSGKQWFCFGVEPLNGNFRIEDVRLGHFNLYWGAILISSTGQTSAGEDRNHNGIAEITTCFSKEYLRDLFSALPAGTHEVPVTLEGWLEAGNRILASMALTVVNRKVSSASIDPNPFNPTGVVTFTTSAPGPIRVRIFDVSGRLVRTVVDSAREPAGRQRIPIEGRDRNGNPLASGVYFIRVESGARSETIRAVVAR